MSNASPSTIGLTALDAPPLRLFVEPDLTDATLIQLSTRQTHYLVNVMRRHTGDRVRLFNGRHGEYAATITEIKRDQASLTVGAQLREQADEPDIWLAFALLKRGPTELIVQKGTELGVARLLPMFTTRTNADRTNLPRLQIIAAEAAEQCERLTVPRLDPPRAMNAILAAWPTERGMIACLERTATKPIRRGLFPPCGILIGPEGGFTDPELDALRAQPFVETATLGPRPLRAETAAIAALALVLSA